MAKKRNTTKPQGTFTPEEVTNLFLALHKLSDAIDTGNLQAIKSAQLDVFGTIPWTTTNAGAQTRARNIRRKQEEEAAQKTQEEAKKDAFMALSRAEQEQQLRKLEQIIEQLSPRDLKYLDKALTPETSTPVADFDNLSDDAQIAQLRELWG